MEMILRGNPKEIAALVAGLQERRESDEVSMDVLAKEMVNRINRMTRERGKDVLFV